MEFRVMLETAFLTSSLFAICLFGDTSQSCSCASDADGGCVPSQLCDPDNNCNKENVAYGKAATMSSRYVGGLQISGPACVAVNGRTGHNFAYLDEKDTNCVNTANTDLPGTWQVDLGQNYTITDITIYNRNGYASRLAGIWIYVDNNICKKLPLDTSGYSLISTITCDTPLRDTPLRGQIVTMSKNGSTTSHTKFINFCEVQIWVCKPGLFGRNCDQTCRCDTKEGCDNYFGNCLHVFDRKSATGSSLVWPITGAIVGGFVLLGVSILIVGLCRRRSSSTEEVQCNTLSGPSAPCNRETDSLEMTTSKQRTADLTQVDTHNYESLQYQPEPTSRHNDTMSASEVEVYENPV